MGVLTVLLCYKCNSSSWCFTFSRLSIKSFPQKALSWNFSFVKLIMVSCKLTWIWAEICGRNQEFSSIDIFNRAESTTEPSHDLFDRAKSSAEPNQGKFHEPSRMPSQVGQKQPSQDESPSRANPLREASKRVVSKFRSFYLGFCCFKNFVFKTMKGFLKS